VRQNIGFPLSVRGVPAAEALADGPGPQVSFNYLGQFDWASASEEGLIRGMLGGLDGDVGSETTRPHVLDINGAVQAGVLELSWAYSAELHDEATIAALAEDMIQALREIVAHCAEPGAGGRTPSDFPLARLDQDAVDALVGDGRGVEDVYPLTPMQAGMLFHGLSQAEQGVYFEQAGFVVEGVKTAIRLKNFTEAATAVQRLAAAGNAEAQYLLAAFYLNGVNGPRDVAQAKAWLEKSAGQGNARAAFSLANLFADSDPPDMSALPPLRGLSGHQSADCRTVAIYEYAP